MINPIELTPKPTPIERPLAEVLEDIELWKNTANVPVWVAGHGTPCDDPQSFFDYGVEMGSYDELANMTIPVETDDTEALKILLDHWPHRDSAHVVLLGAQRPQKPEKLGADHDVIKWLWMEGLIQQADNSKFNREETNYIPTEWVLGVYDRNSGNVTMNPHFSGREVHAMDMENSSGRTALTLKLGNRMLQEQFEPASDVSHIPLPEIPTYEVGGHAPNVW